MLELTHYQKMLADLLIRIALMDVFTQKKEAHQRNIVSQFLSLGLILKINVMLHYHHQLMDQQQQQDQPLKDQQQQQHLLQLQCH